MADQRIQSNEQMVGANHASLADTLNRLALVEHQTDGSHSNINLGSGLSVKLFNTADETTNWEALVLGWAANAALISVTKANSGTYRDLVLYAGGDERLRLTSAGVLALGTTFPTGPSAGVLVVPNNTWLMAVNQAGNSLVGLVKLSTTDNLQISASRTAASVPANFAASYYLHLQDSSGNAIYIPAMSAAW